jgi:hypothetical protein
MDLLPAIDNLNSLRLSDMMTYINFGTNLQRSVEKTNSELLTWGNENLKSPLTSLFEKTTQLCKEFSTELAPSKTWFGGTKKINYDKAQQLFARANAEIDHFNSSVRLKKQSQDEAHLKLSGLMDETKLLLANLAGVRSMIDEHLPTLDAHLQELSTMDPEQARDAIHSTNEAKNIFISKKGSFAVLYSSLMLQITQVEQLMTQQHQKMLQYQDIASVTLPLWRTHALSCLKNQSEAIDPAAKSSFDNIHNYIFSTKE